MSQIKTNDVATCAGYLALSYAEQVAFGCLTEACGLDGIKADPTADDLRAWMIDNGWDPNSTFAKTYGANNPPNTKKTPAPCPPEGPIKKI